MEDVPVPTVGAFPDSPPLSPPTKEADSPISNTPEDIEQREWIERMKRHFGTPIADDSEAEARRLVYISTLISEFEQRYTTIKEHQEQDLAYDVEFEQLQVKKAADFKKARLIEHREHIDEVGEIQQRYYNG